jgi:hypothetical protein
MKNAPTTISSESAPDKRDYTPGELPNRIDTVRAAALAAMLEGSDLTGMESVFKHSTTRLSAVIHALTKRYEWKFETRDIATGTNDGRETWITAYWLPQETIAKAFEAGAREWIESVKAARAERRKQSGKCKISAALKNAARNQQRKQDPRQGNLWGAI